MNDRTVPLLNDDEEANPYNARKNYHGEEGSAVSQSADELYVPKRKAKPKEPEQKATSEGTADDNSNDQHDYKKRWVDLKKRYDEQISEFRSELNRLKGEGESTTTNNKVDVPETPEDVLKFKEENPDLFKVVEQVARLQSQSETKAVKDQLTELTQREQALARKAAKEEVLKVHSDLEEVTSSDEFHDWAESQPDAIQKMIYENPTDSAALIRALDFYKSDSSKNTASRSKSEAKPVDDVDTLVTTRPTGEPTSQRKVWSRAEIAKLTPNQFDRYEKDIDQAILEGRITN